MNIELSMLNVVIISLCVLFTVGYIVFKLPCLIKRHVIKK
jgi:hypothetical protein